VDTEKAGESMSEAFRCGQYVGAKVGNMGTGQVVLVRTEQRLRKDGTVAANTYFGVRWLDKDGVVTMCVASRLAAASRNVPTFTSPEDADAWLEEQRSGGGWTAKVEDFNASAADALDAAGQQLATEAEQSLIVECGSERCGCLDCAAFQDENVRQHVPGHGCTCFERNCRCIG
jgi:uncharacterized radical SAM superfamily Fe-S cluster-containing enzyme